MKILRKSHLLCLFMFMALFHFTAYSQNSPGGTTAVCGNNTANVDSPTQDQKLTIGVGVTTVLLGFGITAFQVLRVYQVKDVRALSWMSLGLSELALGLSLSYWILVPNQIFLAGSIASLGLQTLLLYLKCYFRHHQPQPSSIESLVFLRKPSLRNYA